MWVEIKKGLSDGEFVMEESGSNGAVDDKEERTGGVIDSQHYKDMLLVVKGEFLVVNGIAYVLKDML